jgi:DnaB helicase-like protein
VITLELVVAVALRYPQAMDQLGSALRSDLVLANPHQRRLVEFADDFLAQRRKLPGDGDWAVWLDTLPEGGIRDGAREQLGRCLAVDLNGHDPTYFATAAVDQLRRAAAQVARARLLAMPTVEADAFAVLAKRLEAVQAAALPGLARLSDVDVWATPLRETAYIPTGLPTLDRLIGGWGRELWMVFADSGVGKTMLLQNFAAAAAVRGRRVLHVTLELGLQSQIHRYYRQIAQASRAEFTTKAVEVKSALRHWFRFAKGEVFLLEFPAYGIDSDVLRRTVERTNRQVGNVDMLVLDYLDLLAPAGGKNGRRSAYEDLGRATHEVRDLRREFELTVLTASQAVRRPAQQGRLTPRDMGDSYKKVQGSDGLLALVQTDEEEEVHQGRLSVLKARDSGGRGTEVPLYINRELSVISELSHPNTVQLMKRLGHLPVAPASAP